MIKALYWDIMPKFTIKHLDSYIEKLIEIDIRELIVMVNSMDGGATRWTFNDLDHVAQKLLKAGIRTSCIFWVEPTKGSIDIVLSEVLRVLQNKYIYTIEFDMEHNWQDKNVRDFKNLTEAAEYLLKERPYVSHTEYGVSVHPGRLNPSILDKMHYANIQSYSVKRNRKEKELRSPGAFQKYCFDKLDAECENTDLYMALACYSQTSYKGISGKKSMLLCYNEAKKHVVKIAWWSAKHLFNTDATIKKEYAYNFFKELVNESDN